MDQYNGWRVCGSVFRKKDMACGGTLVRIWFLLSEKDFFIERDTGEVAII